MQEIKVTIDGKEQTLTEEQVKNISKMFPRDEWARKDNGGTYYLVYPLIYPSGRVAEIPEKYDDFDNSAYDFGNYYPTKHIAEMRSLDWQLNNLLFRYSMQHGGFPDPKTRKLNYYITYSLTREQWETVTIRCTCIRQGMIPFAAFDVVKSAIRDVVEPFCKSHPEYLEWLRGEKR